MTWIRDDLPPIDLPLAEQVVLLSVDGHRPRAKRAVKLAVSVHRDGPHSYQDAVISLERRGLVHRAGITRRLVAPPSKTQRHYLSVIGHGIATPNSLAGESAELFVLLAAAGTLSVAKGSEHMRARMAITDLRSLKPLPAVVQALMTDVDVQTTSELAEKLLPPHLVPVGDIDRGSDTQWASGG